MQEGASGSSTGMRSETWQAEENSREEESRARAEGAGGGDGWRGAMVEEAQGHLTAPETEEENGKRREAWTEKSTEFMIGES